MKQKTLLLIISLLFLFTMTSCSLDTATELIKVKEENAALQAELDSQKEAILNQIVTTSEHARLSNVYITTNLFYGSTWSHYQQTVGGIGSGVIFKKDDEYYYALTNFHVINPQDADSVTYKVKFNSGVEVDGTVIDEGDLKTDLAIIRFSIHDQDVPLTTIDPDIKLSSHDLLLVVGNPQGLQNVVSTTEYLGLRNLSNVDFKLLYYHFSMNTSGNSGGAVVNIDGNLVGIHTYSGQDDEDDKFAIPLSVVYQFLTDHHYT